MIYAYNKPVTGDILFVVVANAQESEVTAERQGNLVKIMTVESGEVVGYNLFEASTILGEIEGQGEVRLSSEQLEQLTNYAKTQGEDAVFTQDLTAKFVVGFVKSCKKHPDSDHLSITQTDLGNGEVVQIVCGAPNIKAGLKVVVAKVGAMMPNGLIIWPGSLRGAESNGMICSAKELGIPDAPKKKGILELPFDAEVGAEYALPTK